jgi:hypothetical protein
MQQQAYSIIRKIPARRRKCSAPPPPKSPRRAGAPPNMHYRRQEKFGAAAPGTRPNLKMVSPQQFVANFV